MFRTFLLSGGALPCLLCSAPAIAEDAASSSSDIVVTATRSAQSLGDAPASVSIVSAAQIAGTPARTIDDVLRRVASVDVPTTSTNEQHPTNTIVSMRGLSGVRALVLLDGVPLNDPFFGYVQWSEVPSAALDRAEVVRGGGATLWGNYAMGGVINMISRPIAKTELVAEAAGGSRGSYRSNGYAAVAGNGFGLGLDASINRSDGYVEQVETARGAITAPTSFTAHTLAVTANAALAPDLTARGRVSYYDNDQVFLTRLNTNRQRNMRYTGALRWEPDNGRSLELSAFHTSGRFVTNNTGTPDGAGANDAEYVENSHRTRVEDWGASLVGTQAFTGLLRAMSVGADYHGVRGRDDAGIFDPQGARLRTDSGSGAQRFLGAFLQADVRPIDRLQLMLSLRYQDFYSYGGVDDTPGGLGRVAARHDSAIDPRLSLRYRLPGGFALRGALYRAFRAPTLDNLYRGASVPGYILYGNAGLKPETLQGAEIGFDVTTRTVRLQVTAYSSHVTDFLTYRYLPADMLPSGFDVGARLINAGSARSRGIEAEVTLRPTRTLVATAAYTYADSVVTRNPEDLASIGVQQPGIPRHRASAGLDWTSPHGITLSPRVRYLSRTNGDPDALYRTQANFIADLAASARLRTGMTAFVQIENLFDRRYIGTNDGFTAALYGKPFTAMAGVRVELG